MSADTALPPPPPELKRLPKPPMDQRIRDEEAANPLCHTWIVAAEVPVDTKTAKHAELRQSFRAHEGMRIDALEVYCRRCRRPLEDVRDEPCSAKQDNTHLIGGDQRERAKRKIPEPVGTIIPGPSIQRRGTDAVTAGW